MASVYTPWNWRRGGTGWIWVKKPTRCEHVKTADSFSAFRTRDCLHWRTVLPNQNGCLDKGPKKKRNPFQGTAWEKVSKGNILADILYSKNKDMASIVLLLCLLSLMLMFVVPVSKRPSPLTQKQIRALAKKKVKRLGQLPLFFVCLLVCMCVCLLVLLYILGKQRKKKKRLFSANNTELPQCFHL